MKHSKMTRRIAVTLSAVLVVGCISFNAFAEDVTEAFEIMPIEEEVSLGVDTLDLGVEEVYVEDDFYVEDVINPSENLFSPEEGEIIISDVMEIVDESTDVTVEEAVQESGDEFDDAAGEVEEGVSVEEAEEMDAAEVEELFAEIKAAISLNYTEYTMTEVGEMLVLTAAVTAPEAETTEEAVAGEVVAEEVLVDAEEVHADDTDTAEDVQYNDILWTSSDEAVVMVNEFGVATAVASGEAVITCTLASDETVTAVCVINVAAGCTLEEHVHSFEGCYVREVVCAHASEEEHTYECFLNKFICGMEEHVHQDECFHMADKVIAEEVSAEVILEEVIYE